MDVEVPIQNENVRKIEDIIDIQKANGNFSMRQVVFNLPPAPDTACTVSANSAKSLESGLSKSKSDDSKKKLKKFRLNRQKSPLPDVVSWPSDSDITVLRMKLCLTNTDPKERVVNVIPGDGLHQRDSSSMVNLATLIRHSQPPSKANFNIEEYLMPLTSWDREQEVYTESENKDFKVGSDETQTIDLASKFANDYNNIYKAMCSHEYVNFSSQDTNSEYSKIGTVSKFARFLRLYFCPCCTCLYRLEKMREEPSAYFTKQCLKEA